MKLIYIAGPFSGSDRADVERNIDAAVSLAVEVAVLGALPVCPHANTSAPIFEAVQPYTFWTAGYLELLRKCDALVTLPTWKTSKGATREVEEMTALRRPVFHDLEDLGWWLAPKPFPIPLPDDLR